MTEQPLIDYSYESAIKDLEAEQKRNAELERELADAKQSYELLTNAVRLFFAIDPAEDVQGWQRASDNLIEMVSGSTGDPAAANAHEGK